MVKLNLLHTTMCIEGRSIRNAVISAMGEVHARRDDVRYFKRSIIGTVRYQLWIVLGNHPMSKNIIDNSEDIACIVAKKCTCSIQFWLHATGTIEMMS